MIFRRKSVDVTLATRAGAIFISGRSGKWAFKQAVELLGIEQALHVFGEAKERPPQPQMPIAMFDPRVMTEMPPIDEPAHPQGSHSGPKLETKQGYL